MGGLWIALYEELKLESEKARLVRYSNAKYRTCEVLLGG